MPILRIKRKRIFALLMLFALILSAVFSVVFVARGEEIIVEQERSVFSREQFLKNSERGMAVLDYAMAPFKNDSIQKMFSNFRENSEISQNIHNDSFAGKFIDDNGILNIAITENSPLLNSRNTLSNFDGAVLHRVKTHSFNHLKEIKNAILFISGSERVLNGGYNIFEVSIKARYNAVSVVVASEREEALVRSLLKEMSLYSQYSVIFCLNESAMMRAMSGPFHGGEAIHTNISSGTITLNAVCNLTSRHGLVTAFHVVGNLHRRAFNSNFTTEFGQNNRRGVLAIIDAMFLPHDTQGVVLPTTNVRNRWNNIIPNVRRGDESQIIEGMSVTTVGITTGTLSGVITASSTSVVVDMGGTAGDIRFDNVITTNIPLRPGDSGGPLLANVGENSYFIAMNFAAGESHSVSIRATAIEMLLDITFMTHELSTYAPVQMEVPHFENLRRNQDTIEFRRSALNGQSNAQINGLNVVSPKENENRLYDIAFRGIIHGLNGWEGIFVGDENAPYGGVLNPTMSALSYLRWEGSRSQLDVTPISFFDEMNFWVRVENNFQQFTFVRFTMSVMSDASWSNAGWVNGLEVSNHFHNTNGGYRVGRAATTVSPDLSTGFNEWNFNRFDAGKGTSSALTMWIDEPIVPGTHRTINASSFMTSNNNNVGGVFFGRHEDGIRAHTPSGNGNIMTILSQEYFETGFFESFIISVPDGVQKHDFYYLRFVLALRENFVDGYIFYYKTVYIIFRLPDTRVGIETPIKSLNGDMLTWMAVNNATGFHVYANGQRQTTNAIQSPIRAISLNSLSLALGSHEIQLRAVNNSSNFIDSELSERVSFAVFKTLDSPTGVRLSNNILSWNATQGSNGYAIYVNGIRQEFVQVNQIDTNTLNLRRNAILQVRAIGDGNYVLDSNLSENQSNNIGCKAISITTSATVVSLVLIVLGSLFLAIFLIKKRKKETK
ncbi:MAG: hypothetical protein FWC11_03605 [Firmicutes bacterium]|nr:hypothetical protein [Bacillota bacterium]MCL2255926.1 hypothetical protein [Bacillota bacterium]